MELAGREVVPLRVGIGDKVDHGHDQQNQDAPPQGVEPARVLLEQGGLIAAQTAITSTPAPMQASWAPASSGSRASASPPMRARAAPARLI